MRILEDLLYQVQHDDHAFTSFYQTYTGTKVVTSFFSTSSSSSSSGSGYGVYGCGGGGGGIYGGGQYAAILPEWGRQGKRGHRHIVETSFPSKWHPLAGKSDEETLKAATAHPLDLSKNVLLYIF